MRIVLIAAMMAIGVPAAQATEKPAELKQAAGLDKVLARCNACHGLDYILMNAGFLDNAGWNAEVTKMINAFGASIDQADAKAIADYLGTNYGLRTQTAGSSAAEVNKEPARHRPAAIRPKGVASKPARRDPEPAVHAVQVDTPDNGARAGRE
jgi:sulfite dehydrogenase (cytochrome) subunit B